MHLAVRTNGTLSYLLGDHLGSSSVTTDANGAKTATALYKAFGETRYTLGNLGTDYKFTGQRLQAELGIYWFQSRWMDPSLGRFTSPDTIVPTSTQGTQAWDRYAFVNNNPVRYNDPTGHGVDCGVGESCYGDGTNPNDPPADTKTGDGEGDGGGGSGDNDSDGECGNDGMYDCPKPPRPACYQNSLCMDEPSTYLHPTDFLFGQQVGTIFVYSPDGKLIGFKYIYYTPDDYKGIDLHAEGSIPGIVGVGLGGISFFFSTPVGIAIWAVSALDVLNNVILYGGHLTITPMVPVLENPKTPEEMVAPFKSPFPIP